MADKILAVQQLEDLTGKSVAQAESLLVNAGFARATPYGTYDCWEHPDKCMLFISRKGRIVRSGPLEPHTGVKGGYRRRYDQFGTLILFDPGGPNTHDTGEQLAP